jgi:ABC-2 type transport system permease protein
LSASLPSLLRHELRLGLRLGSGGSRWRWLAGLLLVASVPVVFGWLMARALAANGAEATPAAVSMLVAIHAIMLPLMLSLASVQVLRAFRDRGDLDLLLSAPMPPERVFLAKALAAAWMVAMPFLALLGPFILFSALLGQWRWFGAMGVLIATAAVATGLGFVVVAALIGWLGGRRARMAVHLGSAALGAAIFIGSQVSGLASGAEGGRAALIARLTEAVPPPPFDWAARATLGEPGPLFALLLIGAASLGLAIGPGARRLAVHEVEDDGPRGRRRPVGFSASPMLALVKKELRLLWRGPETLAQVLLRFIYLVPLLFLATRENAADSTVMRQLLGGGVALAVMATSSLAWITVCAEEARELVEAAPIAPWRLNFAKLAVACGVPLAALVPTAIWLGTLNLAAGLAMLPMAAIAALCMAMVQSWHGPRIPRTAFRKRPAALLLMGLIEITMAGAWASVAVLALNGSAWLLAPLAYVAFVIAVARLLKR